MQQAARLRLDSPAPDVYAGSDLETLRRRHRELHEFWLSLAPGTTGYEAAADAVEDASILFRCAREAQAAAQAPLTRVEKKKKPPTDDSRRRRLRNRMRNTRRRRAHRAKRTASCSGADGDGPPPALRDLILRITGGAA